MIRLVFIRYILVLFAITCCVNLAVAEVINPPLKDWVIRPITEKSDTGVSYCSMRNIYKTNQTLVFAKDTKGFNTIGIDFNQPAVELGRQYAVTVKTAYFSANVKAIAASNQVMLIQMGKNKSFYEALSKGKVISFKVGSREFTYSLFSGVANGLKFLNDCAEGLKSGGTFEQVTIALGKNIEKKENLKRNVGKVKSKTKIKKIAISRRKAKYSDYKKRRINITNKSEYKFASPSLKAQLIKLKIKNKRLLNSSKKVKSNLLAKDNKIRDRYIRSKEQQNLTNQLHQLKNEQQNLALTEARGQGESQKMLLETQSRQDKILREIARLKLENRRLTITSKSEREHNRSKILNNRSQMENLKAENRKLVLVNKLKEKKSEKQELEMQLDKNKTLAEIERLKIRNIELAKTIEKDKKDLIEETRSIRAQGQRLATGSLKNRNLVLEAKKSNRDLSKEVNASKEENVKLSVKTSKYQQKINEDIVHLREENRKIFEKMKSLSDERKKLTEAVLEKKNPVYKGGYPSPNVDSSSIISSDILKDFIYQSQIARDAEIKESFINGNKYYRWSSDGIYGSAEIIHYNNKIGFDNNIDNHMKYLKAKCEGDFGKTKGKVRLAGRFKMQEVEMACIGNKENAAVALLFILLDNKKLVLITQEGQASLMSKVLKNRDMIISSLYNM